MTNKEAKNKKKMVKLKLTNEAMAILAMIGKVGSPNQTRLENRLARIRNRLVDDLNALNKELRRHIPKIKVYQNE